MIDGLEQGRRHWEAVRVAQVSDPRWLIARIERMVRARDGIVGRRDPVMRAYFDGSAAHYLELLERAVDGDAAGIAVGLEVVDRPGGEVPDARD